MVENIIKRNGTVVAYNRDKIEKAIASAVRDVQDTNIEEISKKAAEKTEKNLNDQIKDSSPNVEDIQDIVENTLIELNYPKIAKEYIIYRNKRNKTRDKRNKKSILTEEFLSQYKHKPNPFPTELGEFIYYRTYSRWLPEEGRREYWWETVKRAVEYNCSLAPTTIEEAEKLFDNVYHFRQFLSGRTLWTGGTEASRKYPMSNYNCFTGDTEFITNKGIKSFENFEDGEKVNILDGYNSFTEAEVKNFGEKDIYELVVNKGRSEKTYKVTDDHIWFVRRTPKEKKYREVQTKDLSMGDIFREKKAFREKNTPNICNVGIQHGIVFGDGTYDKNKNHCRISLIGEKQELLEYFTTGTTCTEGDRDSTLVYGLPYDWKEMPSVEANPEYILGFIVGYIATDGSVSSSVKISSSSKENLRKLRDLAVTIGINSYDIKDRRRTTNNFGEGELYELTFDKRDIETSMILRSSHSTNFSKGDIETAWKVKSIRSLNRKEETWCVTGSRTDSFTLDTGIHTHNCSFTVIDSYKAFEDLFYLLLIGSGVGVRVLEEDIEKLAPIRTNVRVRHNYYEPVAKDQREEFTNYVFDGETDVTIHVGDSKEGWVQALKIFFELLTRHEYRNLESIYFNYNSVRPKGGRLKTFGGHASGHQSLKKMFDKIDAYLLKPKKENRVNLTALDCLDIANIVGENVVSGGVRRSSEVGLFDVDNEKIKTAKNELYTQKEGEWKINKKIEHRQMSNNSIYYQEKPTREQLHWHVEQMRYSGEPGFANAEVGKSRRDNFEGANPCMEILLDSKGVCNLVSLNVMGFVKEDGSLDKEGMFESQRLNARSSYRMALVEFELPKWDYINKRDRLIGLSLTGWQDMANAAGLTKEEESELLRQLREVAHEAAEKVANEYNDNEPVLITTVKPEGTQTQMPTVSSGLHYSHSPYYFRRVRINADDPLIKVAEDLEWNVYPEVGQTEEDCTTKVVEFPVKAPKGKVKGDVSAIEQLETYKMFMENYVDHNASITVHVRDDEWGEVEEWLWNNWDYVFGISFLSYDDSFYQLMPYEEVNKEDYEELATKMKTFKPSLVNKYELEKNEERQLAGSSCDTGVCAIR